MRDFVNFGLLALMALMFAAAQLDGLYAPEGPKSARAALISPMSPSLGEFAEALGDGTVLEAARAQFETLRAALADADRG